MSGCHPFSELTWDLTPEPRQRIEDMQSEPLTEMPLHEFGRVRMLTQRNMAKMLKANQFAVSKLEQRDDVYVSNLWSYIESMDGELKIVAQFPAGEVVITNFPDVGRDEDTSQ